MKKTNQFFCFAVSLRARYVILFCLGCFAFTSAFAQEDSTSWWYGEYYPRPVKPAKPVYKRSRAEEDSLAGYSYGYPASTDYNVVTGGVSTIFEDAGTQHFNTFGINGEFLHPFSSMIGFIGDVGINFGSNSGFNYNKIQVMVGASILPITPFDNKMIGIEPHLLAGFSRVGYDYKPFTYPGSTGSTTSFSMAAGTDITYPIYNNLFYLRVDYNPTFAKTATANNIRVGVGIEVPIK